MNLYFYFQQTKDKLEPQASARKAVLSNLPRVIASVAVLWQALTQRKERYVNFYIIFIVCPVKEFNTTK